MFLLIRRFVSSVGGDRLNIVLSMCREQPTRKCRPAGHVILDIWSKQEAEPLRFELGDPVQTEHLLCGLHSFRCVRFKWTNEAPAASPRSACFVSVGFTAQVDRCVNT